MTVTATSGSLTHSTTINLTVNATAAPNFALAAAPTSLSINRGASGSSSLTVTSQNGFGAATTFGASGLPSGVTAAFSPGSVTPASGGSATSTLTLTASSTATTGTATVTVTATSGALSHTAAISLTVNAATQTELIVNGGFESGTTAWTASSGVITNASGESAHAGTYFAWLDGYGSATTDTLVQTVSIPSTITTATLTFWLHIDTAETTTTTAYDTLSVQLQNGSGTVLTTLATYSNLNKNTGYAQKSFDVSAYKGQSVKVYFKGVEDASLQTSFVIDDVSLKVQ